ncbi:uncharacterized protein ARMOST_20970 [Armillaria ostoyae]|uniref:Uncharacterized protein n=1 Tax=Armillaria ostoyae TaxID=47428 RepID=A0A284S8W6_ARMOS|nr:uncharacterized protein ARMOST_20970 [Armillaria ostoyae]
MVPVLEANPTNVAKQVLAATYNDGLGDHDMLLPSSSAECGNSVISHPEYLQYPEHPLTHMVSHATAGLR